ncbi:hypothetical protein EN836_23445 [Mesorhizobium sp. M1C.F.Ca.ET.193.01.1.1]|uniref:hypothetical protein n=1 Tax=unclassified Mesorhizobium TaxID=325217 RepID=UPI000FD49785|nr:MULTISPECIES: hypothetical protein [unclassified Mesorhizobium]TGS91384.1 hypothetical protein EN820_52830 [bacterium M00.F.Ca.ET.177.01.1.1]TGQ51533.1 hypothetical protein EN853_23435 [Mesorhizobium sp. M1C.F.Ca.ET.210.01.1.1]TGQ67761.1 hypothetical protein EN855_023445 [Mesorhizobium sp. M1C.F.Ca.ET.212.01.1.1]TGR02354.1 hypothetical protein EN847_23435 [Mesorhizobium sp. M1C.F.Ca.ET.204.01.1.1]TGR22896.1 hypothetical protein EN839_23435 [Mesorhizobium sp. M1C.F.Ca.ET.196.01.1.1]
MTIGILIGIYAAPLVGRQDFDFGEGSNAASPLNVLMESALDAAIRPSDETAKGELFRLSNWDISMHGTESTVTVKRCISVGKDSIARELLARLGWVDGEKLVEAVFEGEPGTWRMAAARAR